MKVLLAGGGTGGHINPAIAIANTIKDHDKTAEIAFIGTKKGLENSLVAKAGYPLPTSKPLTTILPLRTKPNGSCSNSSRIS